MQHHSDPAEEKWISVPVTVENQTSSGFQFVLIPEKTDFFFMNASGPFSALLQNPHFLFLQGQIA